LKVKVDQQDSRIAPPRENLFSPYPRRIFGSLNLRARVPFLVLCGRWQVVSPSPLCTAHLFFSAVSSSTSPPFSGICKIEPPLFFFSLFAGGRDFPAFIRQIVASFFFFLSCEIHALFFLSPYMSFPTFFFFPRRGEKSASLSSPFFPIAGIYFPFPGRAGIDEVSCSLLPPLRRGEIPLSSERRHPSSLFPFSNRDEIPLFSSPSPSVNARSAFPLPPLLLASAYAIVSCRFFFFSFQEQLRLSAFRFSFFSSVQNGDCPFWLFPLARRIYSFPSLSFSFSLRVPALFSFPVESWK